MMAKNKRRTDTSRGDAIGLLRCEKRDGKRNSEKMDENTLKSR